MGWKTFPTVVLAGYMACTCLAVPVCADEGTFVPDTEEEIVAAQESLSEAESEATLIPFSEAGEASGDHELESAAIALESSAVPAATALTVGLNSTITDQLNSSSYVKWYRVNVTTAGYFNLTFQHDYVTTSNRGWDIKLYDSQFEEMQAKSVNGTTTDLSFCSVGVNKGTFYVKVSAESYYCSDAYYRLRIGFTQSSVWEREFNNSSSTANSIAVNTTYYGAFMDSYDEDWYMFTISSDGFLNVAFQHGYEEIANRRWYLILYNASFEELQNRSINGPTTSETFSSIGLKPGTYYLKVYTSGSAHSEQNYNFNLKFSTSKTWENEFNNSHSTANMINTGTSYSGSLENSDDQDWFKLSVSTAGYLKITLKHDYIDNSNRNWKVTLYNDSIQEMQTRTLNGPTTSDTYSLVGVNPGTYYVKVNTSGSWHSDLNYSVKVDYTSSNVWEKEFNDTYTSANPINLNTTYSGSLVSYSDQDWYKLTLAKETNANINFSHPKIDSGSSYWTITIYNSAMDELWKEGMAGDKTSYQSGDLKWSAGTFYIKISTNSRHSDGTYTWNVTQKQTQSTNNSGSQTSQSSGTQSMHRLYNPNSGEHFYTANTKEKDALVKLGWKYEGVGWTAPTKGTAVYRLYNKNAGDHHYTLDKKEHDYLVKVGWTSEGIGWYSDTNKGVALYRQYNPNAKTGSHNYTTAKKEHDFLVKNGWKDEGIAWYGLK